MKNLQINLLNSRPSLQPRGSGKLYLGQNHEKPLEKHFHTFVGGVKKKTPLWKGSRHIALPKSKKSPPPKLTWVQRTHSSKSSKRQLRLIDNYIGLHPDIIQKCRFVHYLEMIATQWCEEQVNQPSDGKPTKPWVSFGVSSDASDPWDKRKKNTNFLEENPFLMVIVFSHHLVVT